MNEHGYIVRKSDLLRNILFNVSQIFFCEGSSSNFADFKADTLEQLLDGRYVIELHSRYNFFSNCCELFALNLCYRPMCDMFQTLLCM